MVKKSVVGKVVGIVALSMIAAAGCGDDTGGNGGSGGTTSTATGGSGGAGGTTSTSSQVGGGGGTGDGCLAASEHASLFTIADPAYCAVARYEAEIALGYQLPSWGRHGGPLTVVQDDAGGGVTLTRWTAPAAATGTLQKQETHVDIMLPTGAFISQQATDVPFFGWTAVGWSGGFPDTAGKMILLQGSTIHRSYDVNGAYAMAGVGDATSGRLLFSALSPLGSTALGDTALYAADACELPQPDLGAGTGCQASLEIAAWGDSSGPVAVDHDGNAFAVLASFGLGSQEARGFSASEVARGAAATPGAKLFELPGFGSSLAAITPKDGAPGKLVFQPYDASAAPLDVIAQSYLVTGGKLSADGAPQKLLGMPAAGGVSLYLITDDADRLWVAAAGEKSTTFVVLAKK